MDFTTDSSRHSRLYPPSTCDYEFQYLSPLQWNTLERKHAKTRWCRECERFVHLAANRQEFEEITANGDCIAICVLDPFSNPNKTIRMGEGRVREYQKISALILCPDDKL